MRKAQAVLLAGAACLVLATACSPARTAEKPTGIAAPAPTPSAAPTAPAPPPIPTAAPVTAGSDDEASLGSGGQLLQISGLVVTLEAAASPFPGAGDGGVPSDPGRGNRWLRVVITARNASDRTVEMPVDGPGPYLSDATGRVFDPAFTGLEAAGTVGRQGGGPPLRGQVRPKPARPGLLPGGSIRFMGQWAVPVNSAAFELVWDLSPAGVARFNMR